MDTRHLPIYYHQYVCGLCVPNKERCWDGRLIIPHSAGQRVAETFFFLLLLLLLEECL